jgi:hypothetical protein
MRGYATATKRHGGFVAVTTRGIGGVLEVTSWPTAGSGIFSTEG